MSLSYEKLTNQYGMIYYYNLKELLFRNLYQSVS